MQAIQETEMHWGRKTLFDDYTKLTGIMNKSRGVDDLSFIVEYLAAKMKRTTKEDCLPDNPSKTQLLSKNGDIAVAQLCRDFLSHIKKKAGNLWSGVDQQVLQSLMTPTGFDIMVPVALGGETPADGGQTPSEAGNAFKIVMAGAPNSLRVGVSLIGGVLRRPEFLRVAGGLLTHPPSGGIDHDKALQSAFEEDLATFQDALLTESGEEKSKTHPDNSKVATSSKQSMEEKETGDCEYLDPDGKPNKTSVEKAALEKAWNVMGHDPGLVVLSPASWCEQALQTMLGSQVAHGGLGRAIGFFDPKCDEDCRVHPGQNVFLNYPAVNRDRLEAFMTAFSSIMKDSEDVIVILEGRVPQNRDVILQLVAKFKWSHKELIMVADKEAFDDVLSQGNTGKRRRIRRGFATAKFRESVFVCWRGKQPPKPRAKIRKFLDAGSRVADDVILNVPVLPVGSRPRVDADVKLAVLKNSVWAGKAEEDDEPVASDSESTASGGKTPKNAAHSKKAKRGRALLRTPTNEQAVPLFTHPMHPAIVKEFIYELGATWAIFATPESGCGLMGALSPQCRVPVVAIARNDAHATILKKLVEQAIVAAVLDKSSEWAVKTLAEQWSDLMESDSSEESSESSSDDGESDDEGGVGKGGESNGDKHDKDKEDKNDKEGKTNKKSKKDKKDKKDDKKDKKHKKEKKDNKNKHGKQLAKKAKKSKKSAPKADKVDAKSKADKKNVGQPSSLSVLEKLLAGQ